MEKIFLEKETIELVDIDELSDETYVPSPVTCGSTADEKDVGTSVAKAWEILEKHMKVRFDAVMPCEIGPLSIAEAIRVAAYENKPLIDADISGGRSKPEFQYTVYFVKKLMMTPFSIVDKGLEVLVLDSEDDIKSERIIREMTYSRGLVGVVDHPFKLGSVRDFIPKNTVSKAIEVGKIVLEKKQEEKIQKIVKKIGGDIIFDGIVDKVDLKEEGGFLKGYYVLKGKKGELRIFVKNENMIAMSGDKIVYGIPNLICVIGKDSRGIINKEMKPGMEAWVIGIPAYPIWKTEEGQKVFGVQVLKEYFGLV